MSELKTYFGNAKEVNFQDGGSLIRISFNRDDLQRMMGLLNEAGYINLKCQKRLTPSQYGHTHSVVLDTWKPSGSAQPAQQTPSFEPQPQQGGTVDAGDIPFMRITDELTY